VAGASIDTRDADDCTYLVPSELEELVANIFFIANHEGSNPKLIEQLDERVAHPYRYLDEFV